MNREIREASSAVVSASRARPAELHLLNEGERALFFRAQRSAEALALAGPIPTAGEDWRQAAADRPVDPARRRALLETLRPHWESRALSSRSQEQIARLEDPETRIVIAGQQPAQWGGPLLLAVKALATCRTAEALEAEGIPAVPVFWIATEDHDTGELWGGVVTPPQGPPVELAPSFSAGRAMLGTLRYELPLETRLGALAPLWETGDPAIAQLYRETASDSPADEFIALFERLFGERGLLVVRPEWLRALAAPLIAHEFDAPGETAGTIREGIAALEALDLPVPISKPADLPLFWIDDEGARHRLHPEGDGVRVGTPSGPHRSWASLRDELTADPTRFSPDALLRPLIQDHLFQPIASLLGPTELAYQWELTEVYRRRDLTRPVLLPRPRVRIVGERDAALLEEHGSKLASLSPKTEASALVSSPAAVTRQVKLDEAGGAYLALLREFAEDPAHDPALKKRTDRLARRVGDDLDKLRGALDRGAARDVTAPRRDVAEALARIFPQQKEGERSMALLDFLLRFGLGGLEAIAASLAPGDGELRTIVLSVMNREKLSSENS